jgi:hypothetical protein
LSREKHKISGNRERREDQNREKKLHIIFLFKCAGKRTVRAKDTTINPGFYKNPDNESEKIVK